MTYDFSTAQRSEFELIPAKTTVPVRVSVRAGDTGPDNIFTLTKSGLHQLSLELAVTEGDYAKRRIFQRLTMGARAGVELTEGQATAISISGAMIRAMLEAGRGFLPTDESPQAIAARKVDSLFDLDGLEFWIEVGIEKDKTGEYGDKNKVQKVLPAKGGASVAKAAVARAAAPKQAAAKPAWAT